jgi:hypothetical protein
VSTGERASASGRLDPRHLVEVAHHRGRVPVLRRAIVRAAQRRDANEVARILAAVTRRRDHRSGAGRRLVVLAKSGFTADIEVALKGSDMVPLFLEREWIKAVAATFLGDDVTDYGYLGRGADHDEQRAAYRAFLTALLPRYLAAVGTRTLVSGNFVYWAERELAPALRDIGGQLLVLHKEGLLATWPRTADAYRRALEAGVGAFEGARIAVYSRSVGELLVDAGVVDRDRVHVVGVPRIDACHAHRLAGRPGAVARQVTFFTFPTWRGLSFPADPAPEPLPDTLTQGWSAVLDGCIEAAVELAARRRDLDVVAKVKAGGEDDEATQRLRRAADEARRAGRGAVRLVVAGEGGELAMRSGAILAFNSTVILEGLAAGTPVVVPAFGELRHPDATSATMPLGAAVVTGSDPEVLVQALEHATAPVTAAVTGAASGATLAAEAWSVLDELAGNADGDATARLRHFLAGDGADDGAGTADDGPAR